MLRTNFEKLHEAVTQAARAAFMVNELAEDVAIILGQGQDSPIYNRLKEIAAALSSSTSVIMKIKGSPIEPVTVKELAAWVDE